MKKFEVDHAAQTAKEQKERNLVLLRQWLEERHPEIKVCQATDGGFLEYMDFESEDLTPAQFEFALSNLGSMVVRQRVESAEEVKQQLIESIVTLTKAKPNDSKTFQIAVAGGARVLSWTTRGLAQWSVSELTELLAAIVTKQTLETKQVSEVREIARGVQEERPYPGYATLASTIVPPGQILAISTRDYLSQIAKADLHQFKKMVQVYGSKQIDDIRFGRRYGN
jgi:hypothetical protein